MARKSGFGLRGGQDFSQRRKRRRARGAADQFRHEGKETKERGKLVDKLRSQGVKAPRAGKTQSEREKEADALAAKLMARSRGKKKKKAKKKSGYTNEELATAFNAMAGRIGKGGSSNRGSRNQ